MGRTFEPLLCAVRPVSLNGPLTRSPAATIWLGSVLEPIVADVVAYCAAGLLLSPIFHCVRVAKPFLKTSFCTPCTPWLRKTPGNTNGEHVSSAW